MKLYVHVFMNVFWTHDAMWKRKRFGITFLLHECTLTNPLVINPAIAEKRHKQMEGERQNKSKHLGFTVSEQVRITPEAIEFATSACASLLLRDQSCSHPVNEPPVCFGRDWTRLHLDNMTWVNDRHFAFSEVNGTRFRKWASVAPSSQRQLLRQIFVWNS